MVKGLRFELIDKTLEDIKVDIRFISNHHEPYLTIGYVKDSKGFDSGVIRSKWVNKLKEWEVKICHSYYETKNSQTLTYVTVVKTGKDLKEVYNRAKQAFIERV